MFYQKGITTKDKTAEAAGGCLGQKSMDIKHLLKTQEGKEIFPRSKYKERKKADCLSILTQTKLCSLNRFYRQDRGKC